MSFSIILQSTERWQFFNMAHKVPTHQGHARDVASKNYMYTTLYMNSIICICTYVSVTELKGKPALWVKFTRIYFFRILHLTSYVGKLQRATALMCSRQESSRVIPFYLCFSVVILFYQYFQDKLYSDNKFLLQRHLRVQFIEIVKKEIWCEALALKFQKVLINNGFQGFYERSAGICVRDVSKTKTWCCFINTVNICFS